MTPAERDLPTGTVTFLFSDIEGSTRLTQRLGPERMREVIERHQSLLRDAFVAHEGVERGTEGDSFFVVFRDAPSAVMAAVDAQRALATASWPDGVDVRVRIGLHSGVGLPGGDDYVSLDVNRAARIAAAGHGGQVLLSDATRALAEHALPAGVALRDLGAHRLKDLDRPERLFQLVIDGLANDFAAPRTVDRPVGSLPPRLTSFVGREEERAGVARLLESARLVTITGPGGTGKTSLAVAVAADVADRFPGGAWFVPLESVADPNLVPAAVTRVLHLDREDPRPPDERLLDYVRDRALLVVLDNFEHLLPAAALVRRILAEAPGVRVLVASQAPLHLAGEQEYPLAPLPVPTSSVGAAAAVETPCVRLFLDRAAAVRPDFAIDDDNAPQVVEICERLEGVPLAIELAAAQVRLLSPGAIVGRLTTRIDALSARGADVPERQRTLAAAVGWSYELLDEQARALLRQLSVFAGGASLEQIERVSVGLDAIGDPFDALSTLVDRSLVRPVGGIDDRYAMLETIRAFARQRLADAGEEADAFRRHAQAFADLTERVEPLLHRSGRRRWLERLAIDHDNIRAALDRMEAAGELEIALRITAATWRFWQQGGHLAEAEARTERLLTAAETASPPLPTALLDRAEEAAGGIAYWRRTTAITDAEGTTSIERHYERSLELARRNGDPYREAVGLYNLSFAYDFVAATRPDGIIDRRRGLELRHEALDRFRALGDARGVAYALWGIASPVISDVEADVSRAQLREAVELFRQADDAFGESWTLVSMGMVEAAAGSTDAAVRPLADAARLFERDGDRSGQLVTFDDVAALLATAGKPALAVRVAAARDAFGRATGALAPPIPIFRQRIDEARASLPPDEIRRETERGAGVTFDRLLEALSNAEDEGITGLAREIERLATTGSADVVSAHASGADAAPAGGQ
jgi:predicted ATPase/class 3 adenylate cyclase